MNSSKHVFLSIFCCDREFEHTICNVIVKYFTRIVDQRKLSFKRFLSDRCYTTLLPLSSIWIFLAFLVFQFITSYPLALEMFISSFVVQPAFATDRSHWLKLYKLKQKSFCGIREILANTTVSCISPYLFEYNTLLACVSHRNRFFLLGFTCYWMPSKSIVQMCFLYTMDTNATQFSLFTYNLKTKWFTRIICFCNPACGFLALSLFGYN